MEGSSSSFLGVISVKGLMQGLNKYDKGPIDIKLVKNNPMDLGSFILTNPNGEKIGTLEEEVNLVLGLASISGNFFDPSQMCGTLINSDGQLEISLYGNPCHKKELISILRIKNIVYQAEVTSPPPSDDMNSLFQESLSIQEKGNLMKGCEALKTKLHPHQMIALNWMFNRENNPPLIPFWTKKENGSYYSFLTKESTQYKPPVCVNGGILADDMGLGKTLSIIALIMTNFYDGKPLARPIYGYKRKPFSCLQNHFNFKLNNIPDKKQIKKSSGGDSRKHGIINVFSVFDKSSSEGEEEDDGFDIDDDIFVEPCSTSSSTFQCGDEIDSTPGKRSRLHEGSIEEKDSKKGKMDTEESPLGDFVEMDEVDDNFTQELIVPPKEPSKYVLGSRATLIVCPLSLLQHWISEFDKHVDKSVELSIFMHYGDNKRNISSLELEKYDVVVTTYGTLSAEYRNANSSKSVLLNVKWLRVVLDEGHLIRNAKAQVTQSVMSLNAARKWVLTGTPIQNKLKELFSLVNWLGIQPFKDSKKTWTEIIERTNGSKEGISRLQVLLTSICMRRVKNDRLNGKPLVKLPPRKFFERRVYFQGEDAKIHEVLRDEGFKFIEQLMMNGNLNRNFGHVFALVMKMRQYCCHPELLSMKFREKLRKHLSKMGESTDVIQEFGEDLDLETASELNYALQEALNDEEDPEKSCPICLEALSKDTASITQCKHIFCVKCLKNFFNSANKSSVCPLCRSEIQPEKTAIILKDNEGEDEPDVQIKGMETKSVSPKLLAVLDELKIIPSEDKVIIVSQFTSFLSMIHPILTRENYDFVRLDGTMSMRQRGEVLYTFNRGSPRILLLSLKAGGIGLNLIAANHLLLLDPAWNPADEDQCFDRIYRIGQEKPVVIYKYIVDNSIEDRILALQEHKRKLAKTAFNRNSSRNSLREDRIKNFKVLVGLES
ncbi:helicase-like transcription factor [Lepeophtheirus salmonis]|uniref:Helicaselike transcription factor [Mustela putorius furo] n=1 Tax=Lepeophtheirus salmonis TaxID=72036 RepID=A0A0K2UHJ6_LEPSM|nr:helicase-like transcription factor [Lepeophtheirus salmonis]